MILSLIVAMDEKRGIGKNNRLPWHLSTDLKRFKTITMGHYVIMGRVTFETIGRPLPGRKMIIVTRKKDYPPSGCSVAQSLHEAITLAEKGEETEAFIIGGGQIFQQAFALADKIYLTRVHAVVDADVFFPRIDFRSWKKMEAVIQAKTWQDDYASDFLVLTRKS